MDPLILMSVLHHHDQTSPALERGEKGNIWLLMLFKENHYILGYIEDHGSIRYHLGQVVGGHALATLVSLSLGEGEADNGIRK